MKVGIPREITPNEKRVAATPETIKKMIASGLTLFVEKGAGTGSSVSDAEYESVGASLSNSAKEIYDSCDIILKVRKPLEEELGLLKEGSVLIALLQPLSDLSYVNRLAETKTVSLAMEMIPRIARAQKLDALSSQSNVAGYKAVLMASNHLGKIMPMMMTAAGTISPGKVLVLGAGVAGLQAIATAKRLGAVVEAFDVRPVVKDQVESLGAKFLEVDMGETGTEDKGGYAKELSEEQHKKELELIAAHAKLADIVITTALIPGRPSPKLITEEMVKSMKPGSVIVDLAAEGGGNCDLTEADKTVIKHEVTIIGETNFPSLMAPQASQLYARNVINLLLDHVKEGKLEFNFEDEIIEGALLTRDGQVVHPMIKERLVTSNQ